MTSWRDATSTASQTDLDGLLSVGLDLAQQQLGERGEFYPFGLALAAFSDEVAIVAADPRVGDHPESAGVIIDCRDQLMNRRTQLRAVAMVADAVLGEDQGDGVRVELEHAEGLALTVIAPYTGKGKNIAYGQLSASTGIRYVWPV